MRNASTPDITDYLKEQLIGSNLKAELYLERWDGTEWIWVEDLDEGKGVQWKDSQRRDTYASFPLVPAVSTVGFSVINMNGEYSPGSGTDKDNAFTLDTKVRLNGGYYVHDETLLTTNNGSALLSSVNTSIYNNFTQISGSTISLDIDNTTGTTAKHFQDLFDTPYDSVFYDSETYDPAGYVLINSNIPSTTPYKSTWENIQITANNTNIKMYYAITNKTTTEDILVDVDSEAISTDWNYLGDSIHGSLTFDLPTETESRGIV